MPIERCLADFEGTWQIDRSIEQADGTLGTFRGTARFSPRQDGALDYAEEGTMQVGHTQPMRATRRYLWAKGLEVFFDDGRPFHQVPAAGGATIHICPPDEYRVKYDFSTWPRWTATWDVTGPRKAYRMVSVYQPDG